MDRPVAPPVMAASVSAADAPAIDLDRIRATLMILGVLLHSAAVFSSTGDWLVADPHRSVVFDGIVSLIHSFRVPGFLLISGLLFSRSLGRHSAQDLVARQMLRLGLPLLVGCLLINGAQHALLAASRGQDPWEAALSLAAPVYHLWFLRDLLVLNLLVLAGVGLSGRTWRRFGPSRSRLSRLLDRIEGHGPSHWMSVALCGAMASQALLLLVRLTGWAYVPGPGGLMLYDLAFSAPMFLAGLVMSRRGAWLAAWLRTPLWLLPVAAFASGWGGDASDTLRSALAREVAQAIQLIGVWVATGAVVGALGRVRGGTRGPLGRLISDASYTIFLLHHLLVIALALLLLPRDWPAALKFALIAGGSLSLSLAFHRWVVRPFDLMRLMFNGRLPSPEASHGVATQRAA